MIVVKNELQHDFFPNRSIDEVKIAVKATGYQVLALVLKLCSYAVVGCSRLGTGTVFAISSLAHEL